jgi:hypothetical protein
MENSSALMSKMTSQENTTNIKILIEAIKTNKKFAHLIIYSLNNLKSYLLKNMSNSQSNSILMIECNNFFI